MTKDEKMTNSTKPQGDDDSFWLDEETASVGEEPETKPVYDLEERTARFGEAIIDFAKIIPQRPTTDRFISQLVGAGTSAGANYVDDSASRRKFLKCIGTGKKEAREAKHFLRMAVRAVPTLKPEAQKLWMEARELHPFFFEDLAKQRGKRTEFEGVKINARECCALTPFVICHSGLIRHPSLVIRHFGNGNTAFYH